MGQTETIKHHFHIEKVKETNKKGRIVEKIHVVCDYCGYSYPSRVEMPKRCPRCQKDLWDWRKKND